MLLMDVIVAYFPQRITFAPVIVRGNPVPISFRLYPPDYAPDVKFRDVRVRGKLKGFTAGKGDI